MSAEELRINYAEIEALHKLPLSELKQQATYSSLMPLKLKYDVAANIMKDIKKRKSQTLNGSKS